ncbi:hypothetical protein G7Z17_g1388 [Cylindrodendrum hubeiense]|uniref:Uncharacterized protein n=1 Tax=Cylindrodendrum hubeiense TaxID=595255 RepID=A0A9P5HKT1_9HYPO|nr:hypothetical protein G7Z17_g1388 [Cylindrodendrum hubeiense]
MSSNHTHYSDNKNEEPSDNIKELNGASTDINKGHDGDYVWLHVRRATRPSEMVSNIWIDMRDNDENGRDDLAKGAGGDYRFPAWSNDRGTGRSDDKQDSAPNGWTGKTGDINDGRGGDYLYLIWKTQQYTGRW